MPRIHKLFALLFLFIVAPALWAQGPGQGPQNIAAINGRLFVGASTGWYPTIQAAVTTACAAGAPRIVDIPVAYAGSDLISAVTGGCTNTNLVDERSFPAGCYSWSGSAYTAAACASGSGGTPGGSANQTQVNNAGTTFAGTPNEVWNLTNHTVSRAFLNYGTNSSTIQNRVADSRTAGSNLQPVPGTYSGGQFSAHREILDSSSDAGMYVTGQPTVHIGQHAVYNFRTLAITQSQSVDDGSFFGHDGDMALDEYGYFHWRSCFCFADDEGVTGRTEQYFEDPAPWGTITTGGTHAKTILVNVTNNPNQVGATGYWVSTSEVLSSGTITAMSAGPGSPGLPFLATSDTHAVSTGFGHLTGTCGATGNTPSRNAPVSNTCTVDVTGTGFGSIAGGSNATMCIADLTIGHEPEVVDITAVSGSGPYVVTNLARYPHGSGTPVYQGGMCGGLLAMDNGRSDPTTTYTRADGRANKSFTTYFSAGSRTSTTIDYILLYHGNDQGIQQAKPLSNYAVPLIAITGDGAGHFKGSFDQSFLSAGSAVALNNFTPSGTEFFQVVGSSGCSTSCDGTVTAISFDSTTTPGAPFINWTQTGNTSTNGTGGSFSLGGTLGYHNYCGAQAAGITPGTATPLVRDPVTGAYSGSPQGDGHQEVTANNCSWPSGQAVVNPNHYSASMNERFITSYRETPTLNFQPPQWVFNTTGPGHSANLHEELGTSDTLTDYEGFGCVGIICYKAHFYSHIHEFLEGLFKLDHVLLNGGALIDIGSYNSGDLFYLHPLFRTPEGQFGVDQIHHEFWFDPVVHFHNLVNSDQGYQINGAGPTGHVLCGNGAGTKYIDCAAPVDSVTNSDGSLTVSTAAQAVTASINTGHTNTYTVPQIFQIVSLQAFAVASQTCSGGTAGNVVRFNDSTTQTWGATITGGGALFAVAVCDGSNWTVMGK